MRDVNLYRIIIISPISGFILAFVYVIACYFIIDFICADRLFGLCAGDYKPYTLLHKDVQALRLFIPCFTPPYMQHSPSPYLILV